MDGAPAILRVGLTGGIASGKSVVAALLADLGAFVVDADGLVHALMEPGQPAHAAIVARFGEALLDAEGRIDRERLGARVFADAAERRDLEAILHPRVREEAERRFVARASEVGSIVGVFEAALLVETGLWQRFDRLIVVACSRETQIERMRQRSGLDRAGAEARLAAQLPLEAKTRVADYVVDNDGELSATREAVVRVWSSLQADFRRLGGIS